MVKWPGLYDGSMDKELAYGLLLGHYLPSGLLGLALVAMFASIMSTVDSNMNFGAQVFINDVYRRFIKHGAEMAHYMKCRSGGDAGDHGPLAGGRATGRERHRYRGFHARAFLGRTDGQLGSVVVVAL